MGLNDFLTQVESTLKEENIPYLSESGPFCLLLIGNRLVLNLVSLSGNHKPEDFIILQESFQLQGKQVVHLWEDVWVTRQSQVLSRMRSMLGLNRRIHGRKTSIQKCSKSEAISFFNEYHLQGYVSSRHLIGLVYDQELVAMAAFSNKRRMKRRGDNHYSAELIRFATKEGMTIIGGLSKLIKHYVDQYRPDDIMSYADRDWSIGASYHSSGFNYIGFTPPIMMHLNRLTFTRALPTSLLDIHHETAVFNTGNLKYILNCK